jgi:hypothetical protein
MFCYLSSRYPRRIPFFVTEWYHRHIDIPLNGKKKGKNNKKKDTSFMKGRFQIELSIMQQR